MAKQNDKKALDDFVLKYRPPVVKYIIKKGIPEDHAQDIAQEVFLAIFKDNVLQKADKQKGRFRNLMLAVTENIIKKIQTKITSQKRGGDISSVSLDEPIEDVLLADIITKDYKTNEDFDKLWAHNLLNIAFQKLKQESLGQNMPYYEVMKMFITEDEDYPAIADKLSKTVEYVRNIFHRAKLKIIEHIRDEISSYSSSRSEYEEELRYVARFIDNL